MFPPYGDNTYDALQKKTASSMKYEYCMLAPALSFLHDAITHVKESVDGLRGEYFSAEDLLERQERLENTLNGVYSLLCNRYTVLQLRARIDVEGAATSKTDSLRAKFVEDCVYQRTEALVIDDLLKEYIDEFDRGKIKARMYASMKPAACSETGYEGGRGGDRGPGRYEDAKGEKGGASGKGNKGSEEEERGMARGGRQLGGPPVDLSRSEDEVAARTSSTGQPRCFAPRPDSCILDMAGQGDRALCEEWSMGTSDMEDTRFLSVLGEEAGREQVEAGPGFQVAEQFLCEVTGEDVDVEEALPAGGAERLRQGARVHPYMDNFLIVTSTEQEASTLNENAVTEKRINKIYVQAKYLVCEAKRAERWLPARGLAASTGLCQSVYLAVPAARLYLRKLYFVLSSKRSWGAKVKLTRQSLYDLEWKLHITHYELEAVFKTVRSFMHELGGKVVRLYCDNQAVVAMLSHFTSRNPELMRRMRRLWLLLDLHDIELQARLAYGWRGENNWVVPPWGLLDVVENQRREEEYFTYGRLGDIGPPVDIKKTKKKKTTKKKEIEQLDFLEEAFCLRWEAELGGSEHSELAVRMQTATLQQTTKDNYEPKQHDTSTTERYCHLRAYEYTVFALHRIRETGHLVARAAEHVSLSEDVLSAEAKAAGACHHQVKRDLRQILNGVRGPEESSRTGSVHRIPALGEFHAFENWQVHRHSAWGFHALENWQVHHLSLGSSIAFEWDWQVHRHSAWGSSYAFEDWQVHRYLAWGEFHAFEDWQVHRYLAWGNSTPSRTPSSIVNGSYGRLPGKWETFDGSSLANEWIRLALGSLGCHPPEDGHFTAHSTRKGAATGARAEGTVLERVYFFGGWAQTFSVVHWYIDPTAVPDEYTEHLDGDGAFGCLQDLGFADFLASVSDHTFLHRNGSMLAVHDFLDSLTLSTKIMLVLYSPEYGISSLLTISADFTEPSGVSVSASIMHYEIQEGGELDIYLALQIMAGIFTLVLMTDSATQIVS
ncbi:hypothetical protein CYMTET_8913, partial [Cymbomonas tetramitiformis]